LKELFRCCIGGDVFQTFLASGLPNFVLSHIWNICDIGQTGKLNAEQFALASYFISLKLQGLFSTFRG
jgi:epidermal growth factor receptor substrate 15